jgi:hypothetical protein
MTVAMMRLVAIIPPLRKELFDDPINPVQADARA